MNHLKDELRRTFTLYALIPTFVISIIVLVLALAYWHTNVVERNRSTLVASSGFVSTTVTNYLDKANEVAALCDIGTLSYDNSARAELYQRLYQFANQQGVQTDFYVLDDRFNLLVSNQEHVPEVAELAREADWGIIGQIKKKPAVPVFAFTGTVRNLEAPMELVIGKAVMEKGRIAGYVLFTVPASQLTGLLTNPYVQLVVKDRYDYTPISTEPFFYDVMNKMKPEFIHGGVYVSSADQKYYIHQQEILNGELTVYALSPIGSILTQLANALFILLGVLLILSFSIVVSVKKQVEEKTRMLDTLVEAFEAVKQGNLDMTLNITANHEFATISEAYNMMLSSLKGLIQNNHEKARATVISEIKQLESQFNPHFLFNTLENIKFMIKLDPAAASKMIVALSRLLRYSITSNTSEVMVEEEMEYTESYLEIQKYRFGQRLNYLISMPEELRQCIVPKLIVQPLIENAVKYGFRDCQQMLVAIEGSNCDNKLVIKIRNNGSEIDGATLYEIRQMLALPANESQHSGLYNVNRRIQLMYGEIYGIRITSARDIGTMVEMVLPVHKES